MIERRVIFSNGIAYDINETRMWLGGILVDRDNGLIDIERSVETNLMVCIDVLEEEIYTTSVDLSRFIPDIYTGVYRHLDDWLYEYGIRHRTSNIIAAMFDENDDLTVATWPLEDDDSIISALVDPITDEEEEELVRGAHILMELEWEYSDSDTD